MIQTTRGGRDQVVSGVRKRVLAFQLAADIFARISVDFSPGEILTLFVSVEVLQVIMLEGFLEMEAISIKGNFFIRRYNKQQRKPSKCY